MSGSIFSDYKIWQGQVNSAVTEILSTDIAEEAKRLIQLETYEKVYTYSPQFMSRRYAAGGIADTGNMSSDVTGNTLTVSSTVGLQNLWGGDDGSNLAEIVEAGVGAYHMPGARPYHKAAEDLLGSSGTAQSLLESGLISRGLTEG